MIGLALKCSHSVSIDSFSSLIHMQDWSWFCILLEVCKKCAVLSEYVSVFLKEIDWKPYSISLHCQHPVQRLSLESLRVSCGDGQNGWLAMACACLAQSTASINRVVDSGDPPWTTGYLCQDSHSFPSWYCSIDVYCGIWPLHVHTKSVE